MKRLEIENTALIGEMMRDARMSLTANQQTSVATWALKTAMVLDDVETTSRGGHFYTREEAEALRVNGTIPVPTNIWIGRYSDSDLSADGTLVSLDVPNRPKAATANISTFLVGHLAIQVATIHNDPQHGELVGSVDLVAGDWDKLLVQVWPHGADSVNWPPPVSFTVKGEHSFATLPGRWRLGSRA